MSNHTGNVGRVLDCTNERVCILYNDGQKLFVREEHEFFEKFERIVE